MTSCERAKCAEHGASPLVLESVAYCPSPLALGLVHSYRDNPLRPSMLEIGAHSWPGLLSSVPHCMLSQVLLCRIFLHDFAAAAPSRTWLPPTSAFLVLLLVWAGRREQTGASAHVVLVVWKLFTEWFQQSWALSFGL